MAAMIILLCIKSIRCGKTYSSLVFFSGVILGNKFLCNWAWAQK